MKSFMINNRLYQFIDILRDANVNISTNEILLLFESLPFTTITNKIIFRQTLQTTLIKDFTDIPIFQKCFDDFFLDSKIKKENSSELKSSIKEPFHFLKQEEELEEIIKKFLNGRDENLIFEKNSEKFLKIFLEEIEPSSHEAGGVGFMLLQLKKSWINNYIKNKKSEEDSNLEENHDYIFNSWLKDQLKRKIALKQVGSQIKKREDYLLNKFIYQLTPEEIKEMKLLVNRFAQKIKNRISLRKKRVKHGSLDIKETLRKSLQYSGVPFKLVYKNKKIDRPEIVVLCDISGSVNQYTRFMLLLTHTLQDLFAKVRTFAFISNMVEITNLFIEMNPERAINSIFTDTNFTYGWGSNYGRSLNQFIENHSDSLNKRTTVLILGDARNNHQDPGLNSFLKIKDRSKNIFWLNPDKKHLWGWSDSLAKLYENYTTEMKEVNSFLDLSDFIDKLFA